MNEQLLDKANKIREGEELDEANLLRYLQHELEKPPFAISVKQFPSGFSNLTYLITASDDKEYVLRRPPFGANIKSAHDMGREFKVLSLLKPHFNKVPNPINYCEEDDVLGSPFYIMERVKGLILRDKIPEGINLSPDRVTQLSKRKIEQLAHLHNLDLDKTGLAGLGKPEGYIERQVEGWINRYYKAETDKIPAMDELADWMRANKPNSTKAAFIHNDYKYDNLVLNPETLDIVAILDWEMATVGHPLMDLGTTLGYWAEANDLDILKPFNLTWLPGNLNRQQVVEHYASVSNHEIEDMLFYYVFGVFKIGVIGQQIYARFKKGLTNDPRFGVLIHLVKASAQNGVKALELNRISNLND